MTTDTFTQILHIAGRIHNIGQGGQPTPEQMNEARGEILKLLLDIEYITDRLRAIDTHAHAWKSGEDTNFNKITWLVDEIQSELNGQNL